MKINEDLLIDSKINGNIYAEHFKSKNLLDLRKLIARRNVDNVSRYVSIDEKFHIEFNKSAISSEAIIFWGHSDDTGWILLKPGTYTFSHDYSSIFTIQLTLSDNTRKTQGTFTIYNDTYINNLRIECQKASLTEDSYDVRLQLELGDEATEWTPYTPEEGEVYYCDSPDDRLIGTYNQTFPNQSNKVLPLYRRCITVGAPTTSGEWTALTTTPGTIVNYSGRLMTTGGNIYMLGTHFSDTDYVHTSVRNRNILGVTIADFASYRGGTVYLEVDYVKGYVL